MVCHIKLEFLATQKSCFIFLFILTLHILKPVSISYTIYIGDNFIRLTFHLSYHKISSEMHQTAFMAFIYFICSFCLNELPNIWNQIMVTLIAKYSYQVTLFTIRWHSFEYKAAQFPPKSHWTKSNLKIK